jgi:predicted Zn-dependent peptidase
LARARRLGQYELIDGNPDFINTEMASFLAVTADQIQAVARKYLVPERRFVLEIVPAPKTEKPNK